MSDFQTQRSGICFQMHRNTEEHSLNEYTGCVKNDGTNTMECFSKGLNC